MRGSANIVQIVNRWGIQSRATHLRNLTLLVYGILQSQGDRLSVIARHLPFGPAGTPIG